MRHIYQVATQLILFIVLWGFASCISEDLSKDKIDQGRVKEGYMMIELNLPDFYMPTDAGAKTKAMDANAEALITKDGLTVLVFSQEGESRKFYYKAPINALEPVENEPNKAIATIKLVKSKDATEKFDIVVIANHKIDEAILVKDTELDDILNKLKYDMPAGGKWNATTGSSTPFPMYGKTTNKVIVEDMAPVKISLYRALARIDVGLNFKSGSDGKFLEEGDGLTNFELTDVYVYKTNNKGYVKGYTDPSITMPDEDLPVNVPSDAERNKDPLRYKLDAASNVTVREIYVPEAEYNKNAGEVHCIVVGGLFTDASGNKVESYYRLDFAKWVKSDGKSELQHLAIIRNHRYVFNIKGIKYAGATRAIDAYKDGFNPSSDDFMYDLIVWNEDIHEMHVHGKYNFGLDSRVVILKGKPSDLTKETEIEGNYKKMVYQTNYPLTLTDGITFEWDNPIDPANKSESEHFKVEWDKSLDGKGIITITTKKDNIDGKDITDVLTVKAGSFNIKVNVTQKTLNFNYTLDCKTLFAHGVYKAGEPLGRSKHYITVNLIAEDRTIEGEEYELWVEEPVIDALGQVIPISFRGKGVFNFNNIKEGDPLVVEARLDIGEGNQVITKYSKNPPIPITVKSNSSLGSQCQTEIIPVSSYTVVLVADGTNKAVNINSEKTAPYKIINTSTNFGPDYNSLVKIEKFNYVVFDNKFDANKGVNQPTISGSNSDAEKWIKGGVNGALASGQLNGQIADIVYLSYNTAINDDDAKMYADYMKKGGVVLLFLEYANPIKLFMQATIGGSATVHGGKAFWEDTQGNNAAKGYQGALLPFPANEKIAGSNQEAILEQLEHDMILNGPFGDIRDKQWGNDNHIMARIQASYLTDKTGVTIYSYMNRWQWADYLWDKTPGTNGVNYDKHTVGYTADNTYVTSFKYETADYNFVWFGDAGFMSSGFNRNDNNNAIVSNYREDPNKWNDGDTGYKSRGLEPFAWNEYFFPIPKVFTAGIDRKGNAVTNNGSPGLAYNSVAFCNIFAWAISKADELRDQRESHIRP